MTQRDIQKALISILVGAGIVALNTILQGLLELLKQHSQTIIPTVTGMIHFLGPWNNTPHNS